MKIAANYQQQGWGIIGLQPMLATQGHIWYPDSMAIDNAMMDWSGNIQTNPNANGQDGYGTALLSTEAMLAMVLSSDEHWPTCGSLQWYLWWV